MILRPARTGEAVAIARVSREQIEHGLTWRYTPARVTGLIRNPECMVLIAQQDDSLAGFAIMDFGDAVGHLYLLAVVPGLQRRGIGTRLMQWLAKSADVAGLSHFRLELRASNTTARRFYQRLGFRVCGHRAGYYDRHETAVMMAKTLRQHPRS